MAFVWQYENSDGEPIGVPADLEGARESHNTQSDAESWLGEYWRELLDAGVDQVSLTEDGTVVYGPMSLHPAD